MICCKLADFSFLVKNKYPYSEAFLSEYKTSDAPDCTIEVSDKEITEAYMAEPDFDKGCHESLCIYRKMLDFLAFHNVFLMHSSLLSLNGDGFVFTAKSGTGKTTHSLLWKKYFGAEIINGDKPLYKYEDGVFYGYGTPYSGKEGFNVNCRVKIKAVTFLHQATKNSIRRLNALEVIGKIFEQVHMPDGREEKERVLALLDRFITDIPFYSFGCDISKDAACLSRDTMTEVREL